MPDLQIIRHDDILLKDVLRIIDIKSASWDYPLESQLTWMINNLKADDIHAILSEGGKDVAYMDLVHVSATINRRKENIMGIGCVCSKNHGEGRGKQLMMKIADYLNFKKQKGILFCRIDLIDFYSKYGWKLVPNEKAKTIHTEKNVVLMVYNCDNIESIEYNDREF